MYKCPACAKSIDLPSDPETDRRMENDGALVRLTCSCRLEGRLDIVVGLEETTMFEEVGYTVFSWDYSGSDPAGLDRSFVV
jgi:hypothetical protein